MGGFFGAEGTGCEGLGCAQEGEGVGGGRTGSE